MGWLVNNPDIMNPSASELIAIDTRREEANQTSDDSKDGPRACFSG